MKKIVSVSAAFLLIAFASSCQKESISDNRQERAAEEISDVQQYSFNGAVSGDFGFNGDRTKAVKTGWELGDTVYLFIRDKSTSGYMGSVYFKLGFAGNKWTVTKVGSGTLDGDGTLAAVYMPYTWKDPNSMFTGDDTYFWYLNCGDAYFSKTLETPYTATTSSGVTTITADIDLAVHDGFVQFYIEGVDEDDVLTCNNVASYRNWCLTGTTEKVRFQTKVGSGMTGHRFKPDSPTGMVYYGKLKSQLPADCKFTLQHDGVVYERTFAGKQLEAHKAYNLGTFNPADGEWTPNYDVVPGLFRVLDIASATGSYTYEQQEQIRQVRFCKGNMYCKKTGEGEYTFDYEDKQHYYRTINIPEVTNLKDKPCVLEDKEITPENTSGLFQWIWPNCTNASEDDKNCFGAFSTISSTGYTATDTLDFGKAFGASSPWTTLSRHEWRYLGLYRYLDNGNFGPNSSASASQWVHYNGVPGLLIYHDSFEGTVEQDAELDDANFPEGCVFLPAAGYRRAAAAPLEIGTSCYYWSESSCGNNANAQGIRIFYDSSTSSVYKNFYIGNDMSGRNRGFSVRLVTDL